MSDESVFFLAWLTCGVAAVALTVRWLIRFRRNDVRGPVLWTALAAVPGVALLVELGYRSISVGIRDAVGPGEFPPTAALACLWVAGGPICLAVGFIWRAVIVEDVPRGTALVHVVHVAMWTWSSLVALILLVTIV
jgi:hypothetical protein